MLIYCCFKLTLRFHAVEKCLFQTLSMFQDFFEKSIDEVSSVSEARWHSDPEEVGLFCRLFKRARAVCLLECLNV